MDQCVEKELESRNLNWAEAKSKTLRGENWYLYCKANKEVKNENENNSALIIMLT